MPTPYNKVYIVGRVRRRKICEQKNFLKKRFEEKPTYIYSRNKRRKYPRNKVKMGKKMQSYESFTFFED